MSNICFIVKSFVFLMECHLSEKFFHMCTADSNVADMNIPNITECFSSFSVTFIEDRFCLFRTWSCTLSKNDLDPNDKSDSVSSSPMMNCYILAPRWKQTTGVPVLSWISSSSIMTCLCSREKRDGNSCVLAQEQTKGVSVLSSINSSAFHSWEDQALSSSHPE